MRNSGNCIYDYTHSFFGEIFNPMQYTGIYIYTWVHSLDTILIVDQSLYYFHQLYILNIMY